MVRVAADEGDVKLEVERPSPSHAEAVSEALAEELEGWLEELPRSPVDAADAEELIRKLRDVGWSVAGGSSAELAELETLVARTNHLMQTNADEEEPLPHTHTPAAGFDVARFLDFESDEGTIVSKPNHALLEKLRDSVPDSVGNRVLKKR
jgi:hypothetical protein